ncbi:phosphoglycerate mutase-like protein [Decorospora gaudefroyi]|uniref:Phosphoglycerate mutase-like protein n=1 Tax=Decorospora gaudefroyi TaxID=184978 RepID=A0A6A5KLL8_9PLEO|nr:phosphoglycerate mutase-like protein [Decorospora gaudefroyi]
MSPSSSVPPSLLVPLTRSPDTNLCSAGSRDSELTVHGVQQATRLGLHFKMLGLTFTHVFSSHLQRAAKTAAKIREAQLAPASDDGAGDRAILDVVQLPVLMEQDFGSMEGKKWHRRQESKHTAGFVDVESKDAMARRADSFFDEHLLPLLDDASEDTRQVVAIISHGIFLSTLWKRLLLRLPPKSVTLSSELQATARPSLEHLGGWSNTGYLELRLTRPESEAPKPSAGADIGCDLEPSSSPAEAPAVDEFMGKVEEPQAGTEHVHSAHSSTKVVRKPPVVGSQHLTSRVAHGWTTTILTINGKDHLKNLKRTGGGVGSSAHDASQKKIEAFFKRRKME